MNPKDEQEADALDALITASLHLTEEEVTVSEVEKFLLSGTPLSPEKVEEFLKWNPDLVAGKSSCSSAEAETPAVSRELFVAMNRKNAEDEHSSETEEELNRKREEARKRLKEKDGKPAEG